MNQCTNHTNAQTDSFQQSLIFLAAEGDSPSHIYTPLRFSTQVLCSFTAAEGAAVFLLDCKVTSERQKMREGGGNEDKKNNWRERKCLHLWFEVLFHSDRPMIPHYHPPLSFIVFPSSSHAHSLSVLREFPSLLPPLCLALSSLALDTHIPTFSLSIPSLPSQLSWLPLSHAHSFITGHHQFKKDGVPRANPHVLAQLKPHSVCVALQVYSAQTCPENIDKHCK